MGRVKKKSDLAYIGLTEVTPKKAPPPLYTVNPSPDPLWRELLGEFEPWHKELEQAARSLDSTKRKCGQRLYRYFTGEPIDVKQFTAALYELNPSLMYKVNWVMLERIASNAQDRPC